MQRGFCVVLFRVRAIADGRVKAGWERRRVLRLGSIVPVDLDVVLGCISSRRVMVLVVRVCVSGRVKESPSSSFGVGHDCAGVQEDVA